MQFASVVAQMMEAMLSLGYTVTQLGSPFGLRRIK